MTEFILWQFKLQWAVCHLVIVNSYIVDRSMDVNKREVEVCFYRGNTGHCFDHECISIHYGNDQIY